MADPFAALGPVADTRPDPTPSAVPRGASGEIEPTEDGVALAFTEEHAGKLLYDHDAGRWHEWDGSRWRPNGTGRAFAFCRELARDASRPVKESARATIRRASFAAGVERFARCDPAHAVTADAWDRDPWLLACPGVTIDLRTGEERAPDPADRITRCAAVAPAQHEDCRLWHRFLEDATGADDDSVRFLQRWCGYALTGDTREHALLFVYGPGGNGKSVFLNTFAGILGDYATTAAMDTFAATYGERHPVDLAMLRGARLVTASETEEGRSWAEARIKALTGGEPVTARFMRRDPFTFRPGFKLTFAGNHRPVLRNVDEAARRRFLMLPFTRRPPAVDRELEEKLRAEWPGILRWMITGAAEWLAGGLDPPETVRAATADYFAAQDLFGDWMAECAELEEPPAAFTWETAAALYASWKGYAEAAGVPPGSATRFGERLGKLGLTRGQTRVEGRKAKTWIGIRLRQGGEP